MTPLKVSIVAAIASVILILVVLELIRSRRLRERYALLWLLTGVVSLLTRQHITDPTSGFQALDGKAIALFAADYPHDYPEVEAALMVHKHKLRMIEVPVQMRERAAGQSSIGALASVYYMVKVMLALFVGLFRKNVTPLEEVHS